MREDTNKKHIKLYDEYYFDRVLYYRIDQARCTLVKRNHELFLSYLPIYQKMWNYVLYFRNNPVKADKLIEFIKNNEKRNSRGFIEDIKGTSKKIMNYIEELVNK